MQEIKDELIHQIFFEMARRQPKKVAFQIRKGSHWQRYDYSQSELLVKQVAGYLIEQGLNRDSKVVLISENRPEWPIIYLGIIASGAVCVPLDTELSERELSNLIDDCGGGYIFVSAKVLDAKFNHDLKKKIKKIIVLDRNEQDGNLISFSRLSGRAIDNLVAPPIRPSDIASLIYTSGTTSTPKGVLLSQANLVSNLKGILKLEVCSQKDNFLSILPLHHTYAFMVNLLVPVSIGATVTFCSSLKSDEILSLIKEAKISILVGVPHLFSLLHRKIFKELKNIPVLIRPLFYPLFKTKVSQAFGKDFRIMVSGGARLESGIGSDLGRFFKFIEGYGLTETSPVLTLNLDKRRKSVSVGRPLPGVEIKIDKPDKFGIGEVLARGPNIMQGYFKQPQLTKQVIQGGWFFTGDQGYLDREGFLFLTGRKKDVIVLSSGKNIYPEELEGHYLKSPFIKEVCILGRKERRFERELDSLFAVVVPDMEYFRKENQVNINERIRDEINIYSRCLPQYQHIMGFTVIKEGLPRTRLNKIKRYLVKEKYLKKGLALEHGPAPLLSEEDKKISESDTAQIVLQYLSQELKRPLNLNSHLEIDLGIDSLSRVELVLGLEEKFAINIPDSIIYGVFTVKELILDIQELIQLTQTRERPAFEESKRWAGILNTLPAPAVLDKIRIPARGIDKGLTFLFKLFFLLIFRLVWKLKVFGKENLPEKGPFIICANHSSYLDGFVIFSSLSQRGSADLFFLGHAKIFQHPLISWTVKIARVISVDPSTHLIEAMQAASLVLRNKKNICIFPEGGRSIDGQIKDFKKGAAILSKELNVPLVPVNIIGTNHAWPVNRRLPRPYPIQLIFGKPLSWQTLGLDYAQISSELRKKIVELKKLV